MFEKLRKWKKHHRIESFGIMLCSILVLLFVNVFSISVYSHNVERDYLTTNAVYTPSATTSLSQVEVQVREVYTNADKTKTAIVLFTPEIINMSTDAKDYQIYYKGWNVRKGGYAMINYNEPSGGYYVFGSTGYSMIYLVDNNGFQNQAVELVVRCFKTLTDNRVDPSAFAGMDVSYSEYDQFRLVINPAGQSAAVVDFLDGESIDTVAIYQDIVINSSESEKRDLLEQDVVTLNSFMEKIMAYKTNLQDLNVQVKLPPEQILGDEFLNDVDGKLIYKPNYIYPNGTDYDWYHSTLHDTSYLKAVTTNDDGTSTGYSYLGYLTMLKENSRDVSIERMTTAGWQTNEGTYINVEESSNSNIDILRQQAQNIKLYVDAVNGYLNMKQQYQARDLVDYLYIEYNMLQSGETFSANLSDSAIKIW